MLSLKELEKKKEGSKPKVKKQKEITKIRAYIYKIETTKISETELVLQNDFKK